MKDLFDIKDKVIVITGAAGLIGKGYCTYLSSQGAKVIGLDLIRPLKKFRTEMNQIEKEKIDLYPVDITSEKEVKNSIKLIKKIYGKINALINNAGIGGRYSKKPIYFEEQSVEEWNEIMGVNLTGMFLCCKEVAKIMKKQKSGVIVNISSTYGISGPVQDIYIKNGDQQYIKPAAYSVSKGGVIALTKYLAAYFKDSGIRVNTLTPGGVYEDSQDKEFVKKYNAKTMLGKMANKNDYNGALLYLISDASGYMTGANLVVDGGWTAW